MNTPEQQATLYRKAAETIEMCAKHGIEPCIKHMGVFRRLASISLNDDFCKYEFPIAVIEGQLVWADTVVYNSYWTKRVTARACTFTPNNDACWSLTPPKQPLCEVEGKPVYKGDKLWCDNELRTIVSKHSDCDSLQWIGMSVIYNKDAILGMPLKYWSWNPPKRTVMVELLEDDAEVLSFNFDKSSGTYGRICVACRRALDSLKG